MSTQPGVPRQRLFIVTGKGGVGKTLISTALAATYARRGERTLLIAPAEVDSDHPLLGTRLRYTPSMVEPNLFVSRVDGHSALKEYVHRTMWMPGFYDWFLDGPALVHFTEAAPGFEELMSLGKLYDLVTDRSEKRFARIVFDAPASGHTALMLRVPRVTSAAVRTGPLHHNAVKIQTMLQNDLTTSVLLVTLAEEMSVREVAELGVQLREDEGLHTGPVIANRLFARRFSDAEASALAALPLSSPTIAHLTAAAAARHEISTVQQRHLDTLRTSEPVILPVNEVIAGSLDRRTLISAAVHDLEPMLDGTLASASDGRVRE